MVYDVTILSHMFDENGEETIPHREWLIEYDRVMSEVTAELEAQGRGDEFIGSKVQTSPHTLSFISQVVDYILDSTIHYSRRTRMAPRRLYRAEARIPAFDSRYEVISALYLYSDKVSLKALILSAMKILYVLSSTTLSR